MSRACKVPAEIQVLEQRRMLSTVMALTTSNQLISFDSSTPGTVVSRKTITGVRSGESLRGIDFRPANNQLYLLGIKSSFTFGGSWDAARTYNGSTNYSNFAVTYSTRIYTVNTLTGAATPVSDGFTEPALNGSWSGIDFNPVVDRLRYVNDRDQNMRINQLTGAPVDGDPATAGVQTDGKLAYATTDVNAGRNPDVGAVAYLNSVAGATTTTLYGIDTARDVLVTQNPPNAGTLNTVGSLGVNAGILSGFDISGANGSALAALQTSSSSGGWGGGGWDDGGWGGYGSSRLYSINLATGRATSIGRIGSSSDVVVGLSIAPAATAPRATASAVSPRTDAPSSFSATRIVDTLDTLREVVA